MLNDPINLIDPLGLEVLGLNIGGAGSWKLFKGGASSAFLFESDGKSNSFGYVTTQEKGAGVGTSLFWHIVYGKDVTIDDYANASLAVSADASYLSYTTTYKDVDKYFHEAGISLKPSAGGGVTHSTGQVIFKISYSFGAADHFWGELIYDMFHPKEKDPCR